MKLLNCLDCNDIVALTYTTRKCFCGKSSGNVNKNHFATTIGNSRILGMRNQDYIYSIKSKNPKEDFPWFVIARQE